MRIEMECPFCGSKNIIVEKRGFSWLYAILGLLLLSVVGLLFGLIGSDKLIYRCEDCGEEWKS